MKNIVAFLVAVLVLSVGAMVGLHGMEIHSLQTKGAQIETYAQRQAIAGQLILEAEKYRRLSGSFRKLSNGQIESVKDHLVETVSDGVAKLEKLQPTNQEKALGSKVNSQIAEFMTLSTKLEPQLFLRDVFLKEPARTLHDSIVADLTTLQRNAATHVESARAELVQPVPHSTQFLLIAAGLVLLMTAALILRNYLVFARPISALRARAEAVAAARRYVPGADKPLSGSYGKIEKVMNELSLTVESLRKERHQFVTAIASDLRAPLVALQSSANMLCGLRDESTEADRHAAGEVVNRSLFRLSSSLDDLSDIVEIERSDIRLDEKIIDIRSVLNEVAHNLGGAGSTHEVKLSLPTMPIWTLIDAQRFERVMVHLISKMTNFMPQGGRIDVSMARPSRGSFRGLEIVIQDAERIAHGRGAPTGPEQDLLRHWVSENGFGMALVQKVVKAHGGTVTASGVAGTGVLFTLRLPQERLGTGMVTQSSGEAHAHGYDASQGMALDGSRIQAMFPKKSAHFGA